MQELSIGLLSELGEKALVTRSDFQTNRGDLSKACEKGKDRKTKVSPPPQGTAAGRSHRHGARGVMAKVTLSAEVDISNEGTRRPLTSCPIVSLSHQVTLNTG